MIIGDSDQMSKQSIEAMVAESTIQLQRGERPPRTTAELNKVVSLLQEPLYCWAEERLPHSNRARRKKVIMPTWNIHMIALKLGDETFLLEELPEIANRLQRMAQQRWTQIETIKRDRHG